MQSDDGQRDDRPKETRRGMDYSRGLIKSPTAVLGADSVKPGEAPQSANATVATPGRGD